MEKIRVLVVEDKTLIAEDIATRLQKHGLDVVGVCDTGEDAVKLADERVPDLVLMDIELAGAMDGISAVELILKQHTVPVIYLSDYTDKRTVERAKKTLPASYLTKPFNENDLVRAIEIAFHNAHAIETPAKPSLLREHVFLRTDNQKFIKLSLHDILYLKANGAYCDVITRVDKHTFSNSMNHVLEQIDYKDFVRVHRSYAINVNNIKSLDGNRIHLESDTEVTMGNQYREELLNRLKFIR